MKRILSHLPKKLVLFGAVLVAALGVASAVKAWYPDRPTFTVQNPAPYVTFNSITDNPNYGDERTFFDAKDAANTNSGGFSDSTKVQDGETVLIRTYVHNDAASNLNTVPDGHGGFVGIAQNTKVRVFLPTATDKALRANSYVNATNANPTEVADSTDFYGDLPFNMEYVPGSAVEYNNAHPQGMALNDSIVTTGAPVGFEQPDGTFPGCFEYTAIVTVKVKIHMPTPKFTVQKQVAIPGQPWTESVTVNPGDTVSYLITVTNTGNTTLDNMAVRDELPAHMHIVPGTTTITNSNFPNGVSAGSDAVASNGIDIGNYGTGTVGYVKFKAKVDPVDQLTCGMNKLTNTGEAYQPGGQPISDTADVLVNKQCQEVTPFYQCTLLTLTKGDNRTVTANVQYQAINGATFKVVTYDFGDSSQPLVTDKTTVQHTYAKDGNYLIRATITVSVNGTDKTATSENCAQSVNFTTPGAPTTPTVLPNTGTGTGAVMGIFAATTMVGAAAHRLLSRRFGSR